MGLEKPIGNIGLLDQIVAASFQRPNDANPYVAGDAVANSTSAPAVITFAGAARTSGGTGTISLARIFDDANQATLGQFELYLFAVAPTPRNDNAAIAISDTDLVNLIALINFASSGFITNAGAGAAGNVLFEKQGLNIPFRCASGDRNLYGLLVVRNGYTPVAQEKFTLQLGIVQD
jgi:hypothetical protein